MIKTKKLNFSLDELQLHNKSIMTYLNILFNMFKVNITPPQSDNTFYDSKRWMIKKSSLPDFLQRFGRTISNRVILKESFEHFNLYEVS